MTHLAGLKRLTHIDLRNATVPGRKAEFLGGLTELAELHLWKTQVTDEVLTVLAPAGKVHVLSDVNLSGPTPKDDSGIRGLFLDGTAVTDAGLKHLAHLTDLTDLSLSDHVTDAGLQHVVAFKKLSHLSLHRTTLTAVGFKHLDSLPKLAFLSLDDDQVTDDVLAWLATAGKVHILLSQAKGPLVPTDWSQTKPISPYRDSVATDAEIRLLSLSRTRVTDAGLKHLAGLTSLDELALPRTGVTDNGVEHVRKMFPKCEVRR